MNESPVFPIADIIVHYGGDPTYRGGWSPFRCFLHGDRNASATVNHAAQRMNCHVCLPRSEDAIGLVMHIEQCDYKRAVEICQSITTAENERSAKKKQGMSSLFD